MKIILIDNYDSFTYNLVYLVEKITGKRPDVFRNDKISISKISDYDLILLSPGPGIPSESGLLKEIINTYKSQKPILGVCLGLQAIIEVFGGTIRNMNQVYHGVATTMHVTDKEAIIYKDIPEKFQAARYHSWVADSETFPTELKITAKDDEGSIMSIQHKSLPIAAMQYHPESILTPLGEKIIRNFIESI